MAQLGLFAPASAGPAAAPARAAADPAERAVLDELRALDPDGITPVQALVILERLRRLLR